MIAQKCISAPGLMILHGFQQIAVTADLLENGQRPDGGAKIRIQLPFDGDHLIVSGRSDIFRLL
jgi:hypothetical protein